MIERDKGLDFGKSHCSLGQKEETWPKEDGTLKLGHFYDIVKSLKTARYLALVLSKRCLALVLLKRYLALVLPKRYLALVLLKDINRIFA